jgi:methyl-accepting chemotaxis protein
MFGNLKIGSRLMIVVASMVVGMAAISAVGLSNLHKNLILDRQAKTKNVVETALGIVNGYARQVDKGDLTEKEAQERALATISQMKYGDGDYLWVNDSKGVFLAHPDSSKVGPSYYDAKDSDGVAYMRAFIDVANNGGGFVNYRWPRTAQGEPIDKISYVDLFKKWGWIIGSGIYIDDVDRVFMENLMVVGGITLTLLLLIGGLSLIISRGITLPLGAITAAMGRLAGGDKTIEVKYTEQRDEIGALARALETFKSNAIEMDRLQAENEAQKKRAEAEQRALMLKTADEFEQNVKGVVATVSSAATEMQSNAQSMAAISEETSRQATAVAAATEEASTNVHTVASAAEELNASIGEINRQIGDSAKVTSACVQEAENTSGVMHNLDKAAESIGDVVKMIEDIAGQVNLLALNATIEAARAGDAGKGFAVVATEVKNLANQTANAAQDITRQIGDVQAQTKTAVQAIAGITETIKHVNEISTAIASAVEEQGAATREIARNVQQASQGTDEVTKNISGVTRAAEETGSASSQVLTAATQLSKESETLRAVVENFIAKIRAG